MISKLGILAHGDMPGVLKIGSTILNAENIDKSEIGKLSKFLTADAIVYIYGCLSGAGRDGSAFLKKLSSLLLGRMIVGFNVFTTFRQDKWDIISSGGCFQPDISTTDLKAVLSPETAKITKKMRADEKAPAAKVAILGKIIKCPIDEKICQREEIHKRE